MGNKEDSPSVSFFRSLILVNSLIELKLAFCASFNSINLVSIRIILEEEVGMTRRTRLLIGIAGLILIFAAALALSYAFSPRAVNSGVYPVTPTLLVPPAGTPGAP